MAEEVAATPISASEVDTPDLPWPGRSGRTRKRFFARRSAKVSQVRCVPLNPWRSRSGSFAASPLVSNQIAGPPFVCLSSGRSIHLSLPERVSVRAWKALLCNWRFRSLSAATNSMTLRPLLLIEEASARSNERQSETLLNSPP